MEIVELKVITAPVRLKGRREPAWVKLRWPNALGLQPDDALGKHVVFDTGEGRGEYSIDAVDGEKLMLRPFPTEWT